MNENESILISEVSVEEQVSENVSGEIKPKRTRRKKAEEVKQVEESIGIKHEEGELLSEEIPVEVPTQDDDAIEELFDNNDIVEKTEEAKTTSEKVDNHSDKSASILTVDVGEEVFSEAMQADIAWHEIHNAYRTRRILSGVFGGLEQFDSGKYVGIVEYKGYRILIPIKEMVYSYPNQLQGQEYKDSMQTLHKHLSNLIGAQIDFVVRGIDSKARSIVASRKEAMRKKRQIFFIDEDLNGEHRVREGRLVEARIIGVHEKVLRLELFGVETTILARNLSWEWIGDVHDHYSVGDRIVVRITKVDVEDIDNIKINVAIRNDIDSVNDKLKLCKIQGKYLGKVIDIRKGVCFIRLTNGVNAVAHSCRDRRYPGKKDDVCFIVTSIDEERGNAVGIITRIIKQNI